MSPRDWSEIREICCLTGNAGDPIESSRWPFFSEYWIGPYQRLLPDWALAAVSAGGGVVAYLVGCPQTPGFEWRRRLLFTPALLARVAARRLAWNPDARRFVRQVLGLARSPESHFDRGLRARLVAEYPAHLHMNSRAEHRGVGLGAALIREYFHRLRGAGVAGCHVFCGPKPVKFYERNGFRELARVTLPSGAEVFCLGATTA